MCLFIITLRMLKLQCFFVFYSSHVAMAIEEKTSGFI